MAKLNVEPPAKRAKIFDDSDGESDAGVRLNGNADGFKLKVNEDFAKRFEHNKKREEQHRLEEKLGRDVSFKRKRNEDEDEEEDESSTDESEDDDAELATADVDEEIMATLQAIKSRDPRVYDQSVKFFREYDPEATVSEAKTEKPMYLQDYHRQNLLAGNAGGDEDEEEPRQRTYAEEQEQLKRDLVDSMHAEAGAADSDEDEEAGDFLVAKKKPKHESLPAVKTKKITDADVKTADKDPETYLSNFMAARAWLPGDGARFQAFDSDESDDDKRADEFEEAYNMRFEDPQKANEKLQSFARDVGKYGVRRDDKSSRAKGRERERERKDAERQERQEDKARLRKLKIEEAEEKVKRIKEAAGLKGQELNLEQWRDVIDGDFDDDKWEQEMKQRFDEDYYAKDENDSGSDDDEDQGSKSRKPKKPTWDDDIDIGDLEEEDKPQFTLTDDEDEGGAAVPADGGDENEDAGSGEKKRKTKKDREKEKMDARRAARKERMKIEEMVDASLPLHDPMLASAASSSKAPAVGFRYRETSPTSFGLSARDILFADDMQLNSFAGLKKMAAFRDPEKKRRDKKKFSKKARLRQWRKETFGKADEPTGGFERVLGDAGADSGAPKGDDSSKRKKKRTNKKAKTGETSVGT